MPSPYPHLMPLEVPIWERYLASTDLEFTSITYDVHLGVGVPPDPSWPTWLVKQVAAVSRKRVDVLCETADAVYIFEIKPRAGMGALGQLLAYEQLYRNEYHPTKPIIKVALAERVESDVPAVFAQFGIRLVVV